MKTRKTLALLLSIAMMCSLFVGCGSSGNGSTDTPDTKISETGSATAAQNDDKSVTISVQDGDPGTLDPFAPTDSSRSQTLLQVYDMLFHYDANGQMVGVLAKDYEREGRVYTVHLYENIYDTQGNHFTANDVAYCIGKAADGGNSEALAFESYEVIDDYTIALTVIDEGVTTFDRAMVCLYFVTQAAYEASGENMSTTVVSTAPYIVDEYVTGSTLTLVKNENYWQDEANRAALNQQQNVDKIVYNFMTEQAQIVVGLETGKLDFAFVDWTAAGRFMEGGESSDGFGIEEVETWGGNDLWFNMSAGSVFENNLNLRLAILHAIDRQAIVDAVFDGHAQYTKTHGNYNYPDADPKWQNEDYFEYDPEYAAECLAAAGYKPGELTLTMIFPTSSYVDNMAEIIQAYLGVIGITVDIQPLENAIYNEYSVDPSKFDLLIKGGGGDGSITRIWNNRMDKRKFEGDYCTAFVNDDHLQELVEAAGNLNTHSQETVSAVHYYLKECAYTMRLYVENKCSVYNTNKIVDMVVNNDSRPVPGACTYIWN